MGIPMYSIRVMLSKVGFGLRQVLFYGVMILVSIVRRDVPRIRLSLSAPGPSGRALCMIARSA